jgi:hypothetical protein
MCCCVLHCGHVLLGRPRLSGRRPGVQQRAAADIMVVLLLLLSAHGCRAATLEQVDAPRSVELRGNDGGGDQITFRVDGTERGSEDYGLVELAQSGPREHIHTFMKAVEDGADPGQIDDMGYTSLHWAAVNGHARVRAAAPS